MLDQSEWIYGYKFRELENKDEGIIYADMHDWDKIEDALARSETESITLVTHNSDQSVMQSVPFPYVSISNGITSLKLPDNLLWYSTNVDVAHPQIRAIPIGLENPHWHPYKTEALKRVIERPLQSEKYLYNLMMNPGTNPDHRKKIFDNFYNRPSAPAYLQETINGQDYLTYLSVLKTSHFTIAPKGNGLDTHRIWEAIYLGSIPITDLTPHHSLLLRVDGVPLWTERLSYVNGKSIFNDFNTIINEVASCYKPESIKMSYWIDKIRNRK